MSCEEKCGSCKWRDIDTGRCKNIMSAKMLKKVEAYEPDCSLWAW